MRLRDADDLEALTSERDSLADDGWIRAVPGAPRLVREHDDRHPAASCRVIRSQQSPEGRPRPEQLEVVAGHEQAARGDSVLHDRDVLRGRQSGEAACLRLQRLIVRQA